MSSKVVLRRERERGGEGRRGEEEGRRKGGRKGGREGRLGGREGGRGREERKVEEGGEGGRRNQRETKWQLSDHAHNQVWHLTSLSREYK